MFSWLLGGKNDDEKDSKQNKIPDESGVDRLARKKTYSTSEDSDDSSSSSYGTATESEEAPKRTPQAKNKRKRKKKKSKKRKSKQTKQQVGSDINAHCPGCTCNQQYQRGYYGYQRGFNPGFNPYRGRRWGTGRGYRNSGPYNY